MRVAAIDIGTNSVHLVVADVANDGRVTLVHRARDQAELGRGGTLGENRLARDAMDRGVKALVAFRQSCDVLGVESIWCAATSAVREAQNGSEFCKRVQEATGIHVRVITGHEEARLVWLGLRQHLDPARGPALLVDIGGGSVEIILCDATRLFSAHSVPLGHIRLSEAVPQPDPPTVESQQALRKMVRKELEGVLRDIRPGVGTMWGTSGSIRALARMALLAEGKPAPQSDHGLVLPRTAVKALLQKFTTLKAARLGELPGMDSRRRTTLPVACAVLYQVMKSLGADHLITSEDGLREGLLQDWIERHRPELLLDQPELTPRMRSVEHLRQRYDGDRSHSSHVRDLAMSLFDGSIGLHGLDRESRDLLEQAALLHDIGHHVDAHDHEKHGQYLVLHARMAGFTAPDLAVLADIVRYHRGGRPKSSHRHFQSLSRTDQRRVEVLSALLQLADALDRSHQQPVVGVDVTTGTDGVVVVARCRGEAFLERWAAQRRARSLAAALSRPVSVELVGDGRPAEAREVE